MFLLFVSWLLVTLRNSRNLSVFGILLLI